MTGREREFADAARVIDESVVMTVITRVINATVGRAAVSRPSMPRRAAFTGPAWGIAVVTGCVTHALLLQVLPAQVTPVRPLAYGMVVAFGAFAAAAGFHTSRSAATARADKSAGTAKTRKS